MKIFEERALAGLEELKLNTAALDLDTTAQQAAAEDWSYTEFLGHLLDGELKHRQQVRVEMSLQFARFPYLKRLGEFDFKAQPAVDRRLVEELATSETTLGFSPAERSMVAVVWLKSILALRY